MKITYDINTNDCLVLYRYLSKNSSTMLRAIRKGQLWWSIPPLVGATGMVLYNGATFWCVLFTIGIVGILVSTPAFFLYPVYYWHYLKKNSRKLLDSGQLKGVLGRHELSIEEDGLIEKTSVNETKMPWDSIEKIISTSDYTYIFISDIVAHILPKASILNGDYNAFMEELNLHIKK